MVFTPMTLKIGRYVALDSIKVSTNGFFSAGIQMSNLIDLNIR